MSSEFGTVAAPWRELPSGVHPLTDFPKFLRWLETRTDHRTDDWFMMSSPWPTFALCVLYVILVIWGCNFMKNREPVKNIKHWMGLYNAIVVIFNGWMFLTILQEVYTNGYKWVCNPVDYSEKGTRTAWVVYCFYMSKGMDFTDTLIMIIRKKFDQVSFLHVYHHCLMFMIWWMATKWAAGGDGLMGPLINTFIHFIMYSYYLATTYGIRIPGKKYLTQLQMSQFVVIIGHSSTTIYRDCKYPHWTMYAQIVFVTSLLVLFFNFFVNEYYTKAKKRKAAKKAE